MKTTVHIALAFLDHHRWLDRRYVGRTHLLHDGHQFGLQYFQDSLNPRLAKRSQAPQIGSPDTHRIRAKRQRLEDIAAATNTAVEQDGDFAVHDFRDLGQAFDGAASSVLATTAVV